MGDVKLAAVVGFWLPLSLLPVWCSSPRLFRARNGAGAHGAQAQVLSGTAALPFGTFLAPSLWIVSTVSVTEGGPSPGLPF
ncbi:hypothetical protein BH10PSE7_BH10PSE7_15030 [soil metagenome]